ncbi:unnamed protein product, partial [Vitis vinifera]
MAISPKLCLLPLLCLLVSTVSATVFTLENHCSYTIWPGTLSGNGAAILGNGGFVLPPGASIQLQAPFGWSGRFWARTGCNFDSAGKGTCTTGDYCQRAGCVADLNSNCPAELQITDSGSVVACKSACAAFNTAQYCCTGDHSTPQTCSPTQYSEIFKKACPTATRRWKTLDKSN